MASVEKRVRDGQITRLARWRDPAGAQRKRTFRKKGDADRFVSTVEADMLRGTYVDLSAGKITFEEYAETWRLAQVHRPSTVAHVETMLRRHAYPVLGARPLSSIRPSEVQAWVKRLSTEDGDRRALAPATVGVVHGLVAAVFKSAVRDRRITGSPCEGIRLPKQEPHRVVPPTTDDVQALADAVPARYRALVILAAGTGLRQGEAFGLSLDRVDFLRRTVTVDRQLILLPGREPFHAPPKTRASHRTLPLPQVVAEALAEHLRAFPVDHRDGLLFTTATGQPLRRTSFSSTVWRPAVKRTGLDGVIFHSLRHYYASLLIRHGESVKVVQARLGHATAAETLDTYSHLWPDSEDRTREAIDGVLGSCAPGVPQGQVGEA